MKPDAEILVDVFRELKEQGNQNLEWWWAIPPLPVTRGMMAVNSRLLIAISTKVEGANIDVKRQAYATAYHHVIPMVRAAAEKAAAKLLEERFTDLRLLEARLRRPGIATRIRAIAVQTYKRMKGFAATDADYANAQSVLQRLPRTDVPSTHPDFKEEMRRDRERRNDPQFDAVESASVRSRMGAALGEELKMASFRKGDPLGSEVDTLCRLLYLHPFCIQIMNAYVMSEKDGDAYSRGLVIDAMAKTLEFNKELLAPTKLPGEPYHIWRYPPLVTLGIKDLGLDKVDGFAEYVTALLPALNHNLLESALFTLGWVLMAVGFAAAFPLGAAAAASAAGATGLTAASGALAGLAVVDFAMAIPPVAMSYMEEREKDLAGISSDFSTTRIAQRQSYERTTLTAAAALLAGLMLVSSGSAFLKALRAAKKAPPPPVPPAGRQRSMLDSSGVNQKARFNEEPSRMTKGERRKPKWDEGASPPPAQPARAAVGAPAPQELPAAAGQPRPAMPGRRFNELDPIASGAPGGPGGPPLPPGAGAAGAATAGAAGKSAGGTGPSSTGTGAGSAGTGSAGTGSTGTGSTGTGSPGTGSTATGSKAVGGAGAAAPRVFVHNNVKFTAPANLPVDTRVVGGGISSIKVEIDARNRLITTIEGVVQPSIKRQGFENALPLASEVPSLGGLPCDRLHLWPSRWGDEAAAGILHGGPNFNRGMQSTLEGQLTGLALNPANQGKTIAVRAQSMSLPRTELGGNAANVYRYDFMVIDPKTGKVNMRTGVIFRTDPRLREFDIQVFPEGLTW